MKYIVCQKPGEFLLKEKEVPIRKSGEALLQVEKVGICGTDLHAFAGSQAYFTYPRILGHELAVKILEIDRQEKGLAKGDEVVLIPYISCHGCVACRQGKTNCCTSIRVLGVHADGGMQEQISVPVELLIPAKNLSANERAIVEPLAIGAHALKRACLVKGETIVVVGCGPIGIGIMAQAKIAGARVIAVDLNTERLDYAKEHIGVDHILKAGSHTAGKIATLTNGEMAAAVFDATGHKSALESAIDYMAHGGRYILVGLSKGDLVFNHPKIHAREASILCSRNATKPDFEEVIRLLQEGRFPTASYITHRVGFREMIANFPLWQHPDSGVIKAMVTISDN